MVNNLRADGDPDMQEADDKDSRVPRVTTGMARSSRCPWCRHTHSHGVWDVHKHQGCAEAGLHFTCWDVVILFPEYPACQAQVERPHVCL